MLSRSFLVHRTLSVPLLPILLVRGILKRSHWPALSRTRPAGAQLQPGSPWAAAGVRPVRAACLLGTGCEPKAPFSLHGYGLRCLSTQPAVVTCAFGIFFFFKYLPSLFLFQKFLTVFVVCTSLHAVWVHRNSSKSPEGLRSSECSGRILEIVKFKV